MFFQNKKLKIARYTVFIAVFIFAIISIVYAAASYRVNSGATTEIDEWDVCKKVTNNNSLDIFVPVNTDTEWADFRNNASGVTLDECGYYCDEDGDGHYSTTLSSSCPSGRQSSNKGDDCCDSDANAYPGQTDYFDSADACGSFDYDCNGTEDKSEDDCGNAKDCYMSDDYDSCTDTYGLACTDNNVPGNCGETFTQHYCYSHTENGSDCSSGYYYHLVSIGGDGSSSCWSWGDRSWVWDSQSLDSQSQTCKCR